MKNCYSCRIFNEQYETIMLENVDIGEKDKHYCPMFDSFIPIEISSDKVKCRYFTAKEKGNG